MPLKFFSRHEAHIVKSLFEACLLLFRYLIKGRDTLADADTHSRVSTISNTWFYVSTVEVELLVEYGIVATL